MEPSNRSLQPVQLSPIIDRVDQYIYKSAASFPRNFARFGIIGARYFLRSNRASSISSERKSCSGHDTRYLAANKRKRRGLPRIINGAYRRKLGWKIEPVLMMRLLGFPFSSDGEKLSVDDSFWRERQKEDSKQDSNDTRRSLIAW